MLQNEEQARTFCAESTDAAGSARLERLATLVVEENMRQNLIAKASENSLWLRHLADSAQLLRGVSRETGPWLDLGTGAGFPGLVIAAMQPEREVVLVESRKKRADWLVRAAAELGLVRCRIEGRRLEHVETFAAGVISARAFAPLGKLFALSARFSTQDTLWVLPKGRSAVQEVASLPAEVASMFHVEHSVTDPDAGIVIGKGRPTSA
uniref:16S rRNA (guanine(527)-N(7))-methyltransferase RsmG n=1 Tax=Altererythrobacter segetis TaxID=1104773 RepID=UPI001FAF987C|nr:16S rRNA (guanine(527)-N(7))-methyltransferase RsmG [Altererythrobacter segetis]